VGYENTLPLLNFGITKGLMSIATKSNEQRLEILEEAGKKMIAYIVDLQSKVAGLEKNKADRIIKYGARRGR
jgi:endonuclease V-like protein UPF0215 family